ncbi:allophanate hydrolase [Pseudoxanthomonas suwonensis]|uniref:Allophanate hydrolase n=1 Tax=Pseudoxanthomonas suwonensis TaxID=314722 RepID=A0A0E3Z113_9GAMM|nr:allophanate hydrolase [Pseudoxanthomonas suwonensis]AKC86404.1 allophanate hydrolase [Pseudoxanthomonas suwonensis]
MATELDLGIDALHARYRDGSLTPDTLVARLRGRIAAHAQHRIWIRMLDEAELAPYLRALDGRGPDALPLYGVPFAIKDNIDLAGVPTTAACAEFAYTPACSATVVERLLAAGAIPLGKTNLDQFATGLVGVRSPWGAVRNAFDPDYVSGGSSSGSAVAVALGEASFALGTDTAGSGRVPAGFNHLLGVKPTRGRWSTRGVVPACRTLDCPSLFALNPDDARRVAAVLDGFDAEDPYSRRGAAVAGRLRAPRLGVPLPAQREFYGDGEYARLYGAALERWSRRGAELVEVDFAPLREAARLLYEGPWVAERFLAVRGLLERNPQALLPVIAGIVEQARGFAAADAFAAQYRLQALARQAEALMETLDALLLPTAPSHYTIAEVEADPLRLNSQLGHYTNFVNLLDMAALSLPAGFTASGRPFGTTLVGPAWSDAYLLALARDQLAAEGFDGGGREPGGWQAAAAAVPPPGRIEVAVCGAHLSGMPLNPQLVSRGAWLVEATHSAPRYRLLALAGGPPHRPGMIRDPDNGAAIELEVWSVPEAGFGSFVAGIPAPLGIGKLELADGRWVSGFICEGIGAEGARDITAFGGWRAYQAAQATGTPQ